MSVMTENNASRLELDVKLGGQQTTPEHNKAPGTHGLAVPLVDKFGQIMIYEASHHTTANPGFM